MPPGRSTLEAQLRESLPAPCYYLPSLSRCSWGDLPTTQHAPCVRHWPSHPPPRQSRARILPQSGIRLTTNKEDRSPDKEPRPGRYFATRLLGWAAPVGVLLLLTCAAHNLRSLSTILYIQDLVSAAQVLLDGGFTEEEAATYLCVGMPFYDKLQDLPLAGRESIELC